MNMAIVITVDSEGKKDIQIRKVFWGFINMIKRYSQVSAGEQ